MRGDPVHPVHPDLEGIEPADAEAADKKVRLRRWKRRLKAAASLVISWKSSSTTMTGPGSSASRTLTSRAC